MTDMRNDEGRRLHALAVQRAGCKHGPVWLGPDGTYLSTRPNRGATQ